MTIWPDLYSLKLKKTIDMRIYKLLMLTFFLFVYNCMTAHDFVVTVNNQKMYFNVISRSNRTVEVTYNGSISKMQPSAYEGELSIPAKVKYDNVVYSVVAIKEKAFSGADKLTGVVLPIGLEIIGDFAFESCTSLQKVVFPGNNVKFGEGVFFKCDNIQTVSLGSDWKEVDLKMFRWSNALTEITIPAKVEKIRNLKALKNLKRIEVDINNTRFSSVNGVLYNKSVETLYGCPRSYSGTVVVADSTKKITKGAFVDCKKITRVDLPAALTSMSFKEFSRMPDLQDIVFRGETPIMTAKNSEGEVFLLQVLNPDVKIHVFKKSVKAYRKALVKESGEYTEIDGTTPFVVEKEKMPNAKKIVGTSKL